MTNTDARLAYIFDLDGTVFDDEWRRHVLPKTAHGAPITDNNGSISNRSYDAYHALLGDDLPNFPGEHVLRMAIKAGYFIFFSTARPGTYVEETKAKIRKHFGVFEYGLYMRGSRHKCGSVELKTKNHLPAIQKSCADRNMIIAGFFEDRVDVVQAMSEQGIHSFTVDRASGISDGAVWCPFLVNKQPEVIRSAIAFVNESVADVNRIATAIHNGKISISEPAAAPSIYFDASKVSARGDSGASLVGTIKAVKFVDSPNDSQGEPNEGKSPRTAADILQEMADTFRERNRVYGDNAHKVGKVMEVLFPNGVRLKTKEDHHMYHLFELIIVKLTRFTNGGLNHQDSIHDLAVYAAMCENLVGTHNIWFGEM